MVSILNIIVRRARNITHKGRKNAVCGKVIGRGGRVIFKWIAPQQDCSTAIVQTRIQLRHAALCREVPIKWACSLVCGPRATKFSRTRENDCARVGRWERKREKKCLYVERHIYGPINSVFKHSHTFSLRDVAYSHDEKHSAGARLPLRFCTSFWTNVRSICDCLCIARARCFIINERSNLM